MSSEVDQLARSVERVSLGRPSRKNSFKTPSLTGAFEDAVSTDSDSDVDMSEAPHPEAITSVAQNGDSEVEDSSHPPSSPQNDSLAHDVSTNTSHDAPIALRRGGRSSLGLREEFSNMFQSLLAPVLLFYFSHSLNFQIRIKTSARVLGKVAVIIVASAQVLRILGLCSKLCEPNYLSKKAMYKNTKSLRPQKSRIRSPWGGWALSALDRVDNFACKVLICILLVACRIGIILICSACLGFSTMEDNMVMTAGIETLDFIVGTVLGCGQNGLLNMNLDANVLQECKTIPQLVFEDQYMCT